MKVKDKKGRSQTLHEVLTQKEETKCRTFVNRDVNACKNILYIATTFLKNQTRPEAFQRPQKSSDIKDNQKPQKSSDKEDNNLKKRKP